MSQRPKTIAFICAFCCAVFLGLLPTLSYALLPETSLLTAQMKNLERGDEVFLLIPTDIVTESALHNPELSEELILLTNDDGEEYQRTLLAAFKNQFQDDASKTNPDLNIKNGFIGEIDDASKQWRNFNLYGAEATNDILMVNGNSYLAARLSSSTQPFGICTYYVNDPVFAKELLIMVKDRNDYYAIADFSDVDFEMEDTARRSEAKIDINRAKLEFASLEDGTDMISQHAPVIAFDPALGVAQVVLIVITCLAVVVVLVVGLRKPKQAKS